MTLRVAHDWLPFTPSYTDDKKWWGWRDIARFFTAGVFLYVLPFFFAAYMLVSLNSFGHYFDFSRLQAFDALRIMCLLLLGVFPFGLYVIWQALMKMAPSLFYSDSAIKRIEDKFPAAFHGNTLSTLLFGVFWCAFSISPYWLYLSFFAE